MVFYLNSATGKSGPFTAEELVSKNISRDTMVWIEGYTDWMAAGDIPELSEIIRTSAPAHKTFGLDTDLNHGTHTKENAANVSAFIWTLVFIAILIIIVFFQRP